MPSRPDYPTLLDCLHTILLNPPPHEGDTVLCRRCADYRQVVVVTVEWSIRCWGCRYSRRFGADEAGARAAGRKHSDVHTHTVGVKCGGQSIDVLQPIGHDSYLPGIYADNVGHREVLRSYVERRTVTKS